MKKSLFIILALILVSGLLFVGCSTKSTTTTSASASMSPTTTSAPQPTTAVTSSTDAQFGGVLKVITDPGLSNIGLPGELNSFNDGSYRQPALEMLIQYSTDGKGALVPWLATDWKYNAEYTTLTFNLRKGVKFHDGTDFNATAAKFSLDLVLNSTMAELKTVSSIDVIDDYTIRLNLKAFDGGLLTRMAGYGVPIVSPTAINKMTKDEAKLHPVGTGPFKFVSYTRDVSLKYEKFNDYWQKPKPYLDGIEFNFISDPVVRLASLTKGDGQIARIIAATDAVDLKATGKFTVNAQEMAIVGIIGDSAHPSAPYSKLKVRQAISYAIDSATVAKTIGNDFFLPSNQIISPRDIGYNPDIIGYPYNPDKAKQLLAEAGYSKGFDSKLTYTGADFQTDMFTQIQGYLKPVGINIQLDLADQARLNDLRMKEFNNQLLMYQLPVGADKFMADTLSSWLSSSGRFYPGSLVYYPDEYNTKLISIPKERDDVKRLALLKELGKIAIDEYCIVNPVIVEMQVSVFSNRVHDCELYRLYPMNYRSENIWLSK
jgi:peptide/nickel transport system substrate-binding protein